jgi:hypothetical protein
MKDRNSKFLVLLMNISIFAGTSARIFLAITLPIWADEAYSIWLSEHSFSQILKSQIELVHPPGYYVFIKFLSYFSSNLFWLRLPSIIFSLISCYLLFWIAKKFLSKFKNLPYFLVICYQLSGYFLVFDWQVRMYTGLTTLILYSFYLFLSFKNYSKPKVSDLIIFTLVNTLGLYFDYGYIWYFAPLTLLTLFLALMLYWSSKNSFQNLRNIFVSEVASIGLFVFIHTSILTTYSHGVEGITWMQRYLDLPFIIPYFLGSHDFKIFTILLSTMSIFGFIILVKNYKHSLSVIIIFACAFISSIFALTYSLLVTPLFHIRSFQIVGILMLFLFSFSLDELYRRKNIFFVFPILIFFYINLGIITNKINVQSMTYVIDYFPGYNIKATLEKEGVNMAYIKPAKDIPTMNIYWSLKYSLNGKEKLFSKPFEYREGISESVKQSQKCKLYSAFPVIVYGCTSDILKQTEFEPYEQNL